MSLDRSLKMSGGLIKHRNVLKREERIAKLIEQGKFDPEKDNATGLPKVGNRKITAGKKTKKRGPDADADSGGDDS